MLAGVNAETAIDGAATSMEEPLERVEIDYSEFDSESISSAFNYAILKYGNSICNEPDRLKNILSDLAPNLSREIKLLQHLCKFGTLNKMLEAGDNDDSELLLWANNAISYLVKYEMIDGQVAYEFCIGLIYDIKGKNIANDYLKNKEKEALEAEIQELLNYAKNLIGEEQYESAEENLLKVCEKSPKQEAVEEAEALLKTVAEGQLEKLVNNITEAIKAEKYKVASDNLEIAQKLLSRCGDNKKVKNIAKQLIKSEEKINEIIQKCLKNVDKAIKKKEYDKAAIYINQAKDMAGNCFSIDKVCSFEEQRNFIEKQIDDREFEVAVSSINALHQNFGLEKEFTKQISSLERKINRYQLSLVLVKGILLILFVVMIVLTNMKDMLPVKENVMYSFSLFL